MRSNDASVNAKELLKHVGLYQYVSAVFSQHFWKDNSNSAKLHDKVQMARQFSNWVESILF